MHRKSQKPWTSNKVKNYSSPEVHHCFFFFKFLMLPEETPQMQVESVPVGYGLQPDKNGRFPPIWEL